MTVIMLDTDRCARAETENVEWVSRTTTRCTRLTVFIALRCTFLPSVAATVYNEASYRAMVIL